MTTRPVLGVFVIALAVRLAAALATGGLWAPELFEYDDIARNLLEGRGFTYYHIGVLYTAYAPPLYPWLGAASYAISGSIVPLMVLQTITGAALAAVAAAIAARLFASTLAALAAGALVAVHPGLVVYAAAKAHPLTFDAFFFTLALLQLLRVAERPAPRRAVEFGLLVGVGALSRATIVIFLPVAGLWLLATMPRASWLTAVKAMAIAGTLAAAAVAPWTIRNSIRNDRFVFMVTTDSEVFWRGNNPYATGHSYIDANLTVLDALPLDQRRDFRSQPNEVAQAAWFQERANTFIRENPAAFVRLTLLKFVYFWSFSPQTGVLYPRSWLVLYLAFYAVTVLLGAAGVVHLVRTRPQGLALAVVVGAFLFALSALQSLYYVEGRHRWAVEPMLLALSGGGVAALAHRYR